MTDRILDLATDPARLSVDNGLLLIERKDLPKLTVPFEEVAVLIGAHRQLVFTQAVFARLAETGGVFVACDTKSLPVAMMLPIEGHHLQAERFAAQIDAAVPTRKRLWQSVVRAKICAQASALETLHGGDRGLRALADQVRTGDTANMEGQAARRYWTALFADDPKFIRDRDKMGRNALLNYGYAMLRAVTARAVCGAGLHPTLGMHHHNRYNAYALADDLMEPFRPIIDQAVARHTAPPNEYAELDKDTKRVLLGALLEPVTYDGERRSLFDALARVTASLAQVYQGQRRELLLPEF
jgi:CRISPR-associated protein Cas1